MGRMLETDARLRVIALQAALRKPARGQSAIARIAQAGSAYFDPFTGLPLNWNAAQRKIYSVGPDGLDDGGDDTFDIAAPVILHKSKGLSFRAKGSGHTKTRHPWQVERSL